MKKLGLIVVIVAFMAMGRLSSDTSRVSAKDVTSTTRAVEIAQTHPKPLMKPSPSHATHVPLGNVSIVDPVVPFPEPVSLFLLGSGLISVGMLVRRRLRS